MGIIQMIPKVEMVWKEKVKRETLHKLYNFFLEQPIKSAGKHFKLQPTYSHQLGKGGLLEADAEISFNGLA